jgi:acetyl esterase/lipase
MPVGYLVAVTLFTWCTLVALAPVHRPAALAYVSFFSAVLFNELPFVAFLLLLVTVASNLGQSGLDSTAAWAGGVSLTVVVVIGLALIALRELQTGPAVDRALADGLGAGWRTDIDAEIAVRLRRRLPYARILFAPVFFRRNDVERIADIRYGDAGKRNLLDIYRHRSQPPGAPVLIHLHGGAFVMGRKNREARPLLYRLASQGWVCISANYRLGRAARFPDHLIDAKRVIAWVREHGSEHGADPAVIVVSGTSAGAHIAAMAALTPNDPVFQPGFELAETSVAAAVLMSGYYGPLSGSARSPSSPGDYRRTDAPPFFVVHGQLDAPVSADGARHFADRLRDSSSNAVVYAELPGALHSFDLFHSIRFENVVDGIEAFAAWVRSRTTDVR